MLCLNAMKFYLLCGWLNHMCFYHVILFLSTYSMVHSKYAEGWVRGMVFWRACQAALLQGLMCTTKKVSMTRCDDTWGKVEHTPKSTHFSHLDPCSFWLHHAECWGYWAYKASTFCPTAFSFHLLKMCKYLKCLKILL